MVDTAVATMARGRLRLSLDTSEEDMVDMDMVASSAFGVNGESFTNKNSMFVRHAASTFKTSNFENLVFAMKFIPGAPSLFKLFKINTFKPTETRFFRDIILKTIHQRKASKERKNDLIDLMLDCI